jgi:ribokinase
MPAMADIAVVGSLNMDLIARGPRLPGPGETVMGREFMALPGGKGANQAHAAARLGAAVAMFGCVGDDAHGRALLDGLSGSGCDTTRVHRGRSHTGVALIHVAEEQGGNAIMVLPGANAEYDLDKWAQDAADVTRSRILLLQGEIPPAATIAAARRAKAAGVTVILDPAPASGLQDEIFEYVDILTPNEHELAELAGMGGTRELSGGRLHEAAERLGSRLQGALVAKLGGQGCLLRAGEAVTRIAAVPAPVVDTTGAGDVFNAALAVALLEGRGLVECCTFAGHAAALSVGRKGAQSSAPDRREVDASVQAAIG